MRGRHKAKIPPTNQQLGAAKLVAVCGRAADEQTVAQRIETGLTAAWHKCTRATGSGTSSNRLEARESNERPSLSFPTKAYWSIAADGREWTGMFLCFVPALSTRCKRPHRVDGSNPTHQGLRVTTSAPTVTDLVAPACERGEGDSLCWLHHAIHVAIYITNEHLTQEFFFSHAHDIAAAAFLSVCVFASFVRLLSALQFASFFAFFSKQAHRVVAEQADLDSASTIPSLFDT